MGVISRLQKLASIPGALVRAVQRNGLRNVLNFGFSLLRGRGLAGSARYAMLTSAQRKVDAAEGAKPGFDPSTEDRDADLDETFALPTGSWQQHLAELKVRQAKHEMRPQAHLSVIVRCLAGDGRAEVERTLASLSAMKSRVSGVPLRVTIEGDLLEYFEVPADIEIAQSFYIDSNATKESWVLFARAGDVFSGEFLEYTGKALNDNEIFAITFDGTYEEGEKTFPLFHPGANPTLARAMDYTLSRIVLRRGLMTGGEIRTPYDNLVEWLSKTDSISARARWAHIARPLVELNLRGTPLKQLCHRVKPIQPHSAGNNVSVLICTKDSGRLLEQLLRNLQTCKIHIKDIWIISNNTTNEYAINLLKYSNKKSNITVIYYNEPFNFSKMSNMGATKSTGDRILFLNDDIIPITEDWLGIMLAALDRDPDVGVVGPLLIYPNERIQHAGMYLGHRGAAGHTLRFAKDPEAGYLYYTTAPREVSALTGAVMLTTRRCFDALGGFDESLATYLQDVDFSLRAKHSGFANVFEPRSVLIHMESISIAPMTRLPALNNQRALEFARFRRRWGATIDEGDDLHNNNFDISDEGLRSLFK